MPESDQRTALPTELHIGSSHDAGSFRLAQEYVALHGVRGSAVPPAAVMTLEQDGIAVVPTSAAGTQRSGPVYTNASGTSFAVPTGRVFLRLHEGHKVEALRDALERAGFVIEQVPVYAPHAAWLMPESGDVASALSALPQLAQLDAVASVEPELLARRAQR